MDDVCSLARPMTAGDASRSLLRWAVVGAASAILFVLAMMQGGSVGAAAPTTYDNTVCINYTTCYPTAAPTTTTTTNTGTGIPGNAVVSTYVDPRYCNGVVSVVTDASGNLIDVCPATGQRIFPVFPDYGFGAGFVGSNFIGSNFVGANFVNGTFIAPGTANGITCNGVYGCPFGGGFVGNNFNGNNFNGNNNVNFLNGNVCGFNNCNTFPAGATFVGGNTFLYNDNRFCTDGKVAFVQNRGYFCQNGGPLVTNNFTTTVNCGNFFLNGCGIYRPFEANTAAPAAPQQATPVTTYAVTPKAAAPVVQAAAPVVQAATPMTQQAAPVVAKAQTAPATAAPATNKPAGTITADDHRG
ncbi:MAG: hypothetical protein M3176_17645 [Chloroflexota bacterium]|nr:hypothetical protein [Chloroflexota bacterium]MDQ6908650.1 hypothetical protein [Chloroflexota bacterium]